MAKVTEFCPECGHEVKIEAWPYTLQKCPQCGAPIRACCLCDCDIVDCSVCQNKYNQIIKK